MKIKRILVAIAISFCSFILYITNVQHLKSMKLIVSKPKSVQLHNSSSSSLVTKSQSEDDFIVAKNSDHQLIEPIKNNVDLMTPFQVAVQGLNFNKKASIYNKKNSLEVGNILKLFILLAYHKALLEKNPKLTKPYKVMAGDVKGKGLIVNTSYAYPFLIQQMMYHNSNDAANILVKVLKLEYINKVAAELGAKSTKIINSFDQKDVGQTTANDMITIFTKLYRRQILTVNDCNLILRLLNTYPNKGLAAGIPGICHYISDDNASCCLVNKNGKVYIIAAIGGDKNRFNQLGKDVYNVIAMHK